MALEFLDEDVETQGAGGIEFLDESPPSGFPSPRDALLSELESLRSGQSLKPVGSFEGLEGSAYRGIMAIPEMFETAKVASIASQPKTFRSGRRAFERAMTDPLYGQQLAEAAGDTQLQQSIDRQRGPIAQERAPLRSAIQDVAERQQLKRAFPQSEAQQRLGRAATSSEQWAAWRQDPVELTSSVILESLPPSVVGAIVGTATGGPGVGTAVGAGGSSGLLTFSGEFLGSAQEQGYDITDPIQLEMFLDNEKALDKAIKTAGTKAGIVGTVDALTAGQAGRFIGPVLKQGLKSRVVATGKELLLQAAGGAGGEATGQVATGQPINTFDIGMEALAEIGTGPAEVASNLRSRKSPATAQPTTTTDQPQFSQDIEFLPEGESALQGAPLQQEVQNAIQQESQTVPRNVQQSQVTQEGQGQVPVEEGRQEATQAQVTTVDELVSMPVDQAVDYFTATEEGGQRKVAPHREGIRAGLQLGPQDVERLHSQALEAQQKANEAAEQGNDDVFLAESGKVTFINGAIEGALREGPNYTQFVQQFGEPAARTEQIITPESLGFKPAPEIGQNIQRLEIPGEGEVRADFSGTGTIKLEFVGVTGERGKGTGTKLVEEVKKVADSQKRPVLLTAHSVEGRQEDLNRFYERRGFRRLAYDTKTGRPIYGYTPASVRESGAETATGFFKRTQEPPPPTPPATTEGAAAPEPAPEPTKTLEDAYRIFDPKPKEKATARLKDKLINIIEAVRTGVASKFRPIDRLAEDIAKAYGLTKPKSIAAIAEQLKGASGKAEATIYNFDRDVSSEVRGHEKDFSVYMFLRRSLDRLNQDIAAAREGGEVRRQVADWTIPDLESNLAALEAQVGPVTTAKFEQAAQRYQQYMDQALRLQVESGRMSQEVYDAIKAGNEFYAPFKLLKYLEATSMPEGTGSRIDTQAQLTKAMEGVTDEDFRLADMLAAGRQNLMISRILADKNNVMRRVADLSIVDQNGWFIKKLKGSETAPEGMEEVTVFENGEKVRYAVNRDVKDALQIYGSRTGGMISEVLAKAAVPFRIGATAFNVPFQVGNLLVDVGRSALVSKYGLRGISDMVMFPMDLIHAAYSTMLANLAGVNTQLYQDFLESGAAGATVQEHLTPEMLRFKPTSPAGIGRKVAGGVINSIPAFAKAIEETSKTLGVKRAMRFEKYIDASTGELKPAKSGDELARAIPEAITEIRRFSGSPDFGRQGRWTEQARLNLLYMFLNARIQGTLADVGRLSGRDGAKTAAITWARLGMAVGIPSMLLFMLNNDDDNADDYAKRPKKEKENYWLIPKGTASGEPQYITTEDGQQIRDYWRIPKRESLKWMANAVESGMEFAQNRTPVEFAGFARTMMEEISPVNIEGDTFQERLESTGASLNPILKAPIEFSTGRDMYHHKELITNPNMRKADPEQQYTDRTATVFRRAAELMPDVAPESLRSPIMLENLTRNLTAGLITQFLPRKPVEGRSKAESFPLFQRFQAVPYTQDSSFMEQFKELERESANEILTRQRNVNSILESNKGAGLKTLVKDALEKHPGDVRLVRNLVDRWQSRQAGVTFEESRVLSLPVSQRARYMANLMANAQNDIERQRIIDENAKKRILTEAVYEEMLELMAPAE